MRSTTLAAASAPTTLADLIGAYARPLIYIAHDTDNPVDPAALDLDHFADLVAAIRHDLPTATEAPARTRAITVVGQWNITARSGEDLRIVAVSTLADGEKGVASEVYEFNRKHLLDADLSSRAS